MMIIHAAMMLVRLLNPFHYAVSDLDTLNWNSAVFKYLSHHHNNLELPPISITTNLVFTYV